MFVHVINMYGESYYIAVRDISYFFGVKESRYVTIKLRDGTTIQTGNNMQQVLEAFNNQTDFREADP